MYKSKGTRNHDVQSEKQRLASTKAWKLFRVTGMITSIKNIGATDQRIKADCDHIAGLLSRVEHILRGGCMQCGPVEKSK